MKLSVKQGVISMKKSFYESKMLFTIKKDQKCKVFRFWAKTVKVVKNGALTEKHYSGRAEAVNKINFGLKLCFHQINNTKVSRKGFKD